MHYKSQLHNFLKKLGISESAYNLFELYEVILSEKIKNSTWFQNHPFKIFGSHIFWLHSYCRFSRFKWFPHYGFWEWGWLSGNTTKIIYPSIELFCVESIRKKVLFIKLLKQELNLSETTIIHSRFEDLEQSLENSFDYLVVRAVKMNDEYFLKAFSLLKPSGKLILYKSKVNNDEVDKIKQYANCDTIEIIRKEYSGLGKRAVIIVKKHG